MVFCQVSVGSWVDDVLAQAIDMTLETRTVYRGPERNRFVTGKDHVLRVVLWQLATVKLDTGVASGT